MVENKTATLRSLIDGFGSAKPFLGEKLFSLLELEGFHSGVAQNLLT